MLLLTLWWDILFYGHQIFLPVRVLSFNSVSFPFTGIYSASTALAHLIQVCHSQITVIAMSQEGRIHANYQMVRVEDLDALVTAWYDIICTNCKHVTSHRHVDQGEMIPLALLVSCAFFISLLNTFCKCLDIDRLACMFIRVRTFFNVVVVLLLNMKLCSQTVGVNHLEILASRSAVQ